MRSESQTFGTPPRASETQQARTPSMTAILEYVDPTMLPQETREILEQIGPFLADGLSAREIGQRFGRSEDWAATRILKVKRALILEAARNAAEMEAGLRARVEQLAAELDGGQRRDG